MCHAQWQLGSVHSVAVNLAHICTHKHGRHRRAQATDRRVPRGSAAHITAPCVRPCLGGAPPNCPTVRDEQSAGHIGRTGKRNGHSNADRGEMIGNASVCRGDHQSSFEHSPTRSHRAVTWPNAALQCDCWSCQVATQNTKQIVLNFN